MFAQTALEIELGRQLQHDRIAGLGRPDLFDPAMDVESRRAPRLRRLRALPHRARRAL
jgi:hypothetical protein